MKSLCVRKFAFHHFQSCDTCDSVIPLNKVLKIKLQCIQNSKLPVYSVPCLILKKNINSILIYNIYIHLLLFFHIICSHLCLRYLQQRFAC